jgi:hypothetical protein
MSFEQFYPVALLEREFVLSLSNIVPHCYQIMGHVKLKRQKGFERILLKLVGEGFD